MLSFEDSTTTNPKKLIIIIIKIDMKIRIQIWISVKDSPIKHHHQFFSENRFIFIFNKFNVFLLFVVVVEWKFIHFKFMWYKNLLLNVFFFSDLIGFSFFCFEIKSRKALIMGKKMEKILLFFLFRNKAKTKWNNSVIIIIIMAVGWMGKKSEIKNVIFFRGFSERKM